MREIKFRGKRIDNGEWVYGDLVHCAHRTYIKDCNDKYTNPRRLAENTADFRCIEVAPSTVGQCTGLKDKNGNEIYEGDIVRREFCHYQNMFDPYTLGFVDSEIEGEGYWIGAIKYLPSCGFVMGKVIEVDEYNESKKRSRRKNIIQYKSKVIGNIHDNPELLAANKLLC